MSKSPAGLAAVLQAITRGPQRSSLFYWLYDHHDALVEAVAGRPIRWAPLCREFADLGLTDRTGKPASPAIARKTWRTVRREVAQQRRGQPEVRLTSIGPATPAKARSPLRPTPFPQARTVPEPASRGPAVAASDRKPAMRQFKVFKSLDDIQPPQQPELPSISEPEPCGSSLLPAPKWPKPVL